MPSGEKLFLYTVISVGLRGLLAAGLAVQQAGAAQRAASEPPAGAEPQIHGVPSSPTAVETIDGRYVPATPPFHSQVILNATNSKPYWTPRVRPPKPTPTEERQLRESAAPARVNR